VGAIARLGTARFRHGGHGSALAFSADGRWLYAGARTGILVWEVATGKLHATLPVPSESFGALLTLSPDGKHLAASDGRYTVRLWDLGSGKPRDLEGHRGLICASAFSPDSRTLVTAASDFHDWEPSAKTVDRVTRLWDVGTGKLVRTLDDHPETLSAAIFLDDKHVVTGDAKGVVRVWSLEPGKVVRRLESTGTWIRDLWFGADGKILLACVTPPSKFRPPRGLTSAQNLTPGGVSLRPASVVVGWNLSTGEALPGFSGLPDPARTFAVSRDGKRLALCNATTIPVYDTATCKEVTRLTSPHASFWAVAFSPDGKQVAAVNGPRICLWDLATGKEQFVHPGHPDGIQFVRVLPDGKTALSVSSDGIRLWEAATGKPRRHVELEEAFSAAAFDLSPDGKTLATSCPAFSGGLWDVTSGKKRAQLTADDMFLHARQLTFAPDGKTLVVMTRTHKHATIGLFESSGKELVKFGSGFIPDSWIAYSPDGRYLLIVGRERELWEVATPKLLDWTGSKFAHAAFLAQAAKAWGPSSRAAIAQRGLILWDLALCEDRDLPACPWKALLALAPGGKVAAFRNNDGTAVDLRDTRTGKLLARVDGHRGEVKSAAFSPDGKHVVTGGDDSTLLVWDVSAILLQPRPALTLSAAELDALWRALGSDSRSVPIAAIDRLAAAPDATMKFLQSKLLRLSTTGLKGWLVDLDSDVFARRDLAMCELARLEFAAEKALRQLLQGKPVLEVRLRAEKLLRELNDPITSPQLLASWHAITVLEQINNSAARDLLESLARGAPEARLTREARAALQRLSFH
jgi:WD40 repeat protein